MTGIVERSTMGKTTEGYGSQQTGGERWQAVKADNRATIRGNIVQLEKDQRWKSTYSDRNTVHMVTSQFVLQAALWNWSVGAVWGSLRRPPWPTILGLYGLGCPIVYSRDTLRKFLERLTGKLKRVVRDICNSREMLAFLSSTFCNDSQYFAPLSSPLTFTSGYNMYVSWLYYFSERAYFAHTGLLDSEPSSCRSHLLTIYRDHRWSVASARR